MQLQLYDRKIWVYQKSIDFRKSINGLTSFITQELKENPQDSVFLFYNKNKDKIKCLSYHKNGFILVYKQLSQGRFYFNFNKEKDVSEMDLDELGWLLAGLEWQKMRNWLELSYNKFS